MSDLPVPVSVQANDSAQPAPAEPYALARRGWTPAARPVAPAQARWLPAATRAATQTLAPRPVWPALPGAAGDDTLDAEAPPAPEVPPREAQAAWAEGADVFRTVTADAAQQDAPAPSPGAASPAPPPVPMAASSARSTEAPTATVTPARHAPTEPPAQTSPSAARSAWRQVAAWIDGGTPRAGDAPAPAAAPRAQPATAAPTAAPVPPAVRTDSRTAQGNVAPREPAPRRSEDIVVPLRRAAQAPAPSAVGAVHVARDTSLPAAPPAAWREPGPGSADRPSAGPAARRPVAVTPAASPAPSAMAWPDLSALLSPAAAALTLRIDHLEVVAPAPKPVEATAARSANAAPPAPDAGAAARPAARAYRNPWSTRRAGWD